MVIILPDSNDPIYLSTITYYRNGKQSSKFQLTVEWNSPKKLGI